MSSTTQTVLLIAAVGVGFYLLSDKRSGDGPGAGGGGGGGEGDHAGNSVERTVRTTTNLGKAVKSFWELFQ